MAHADAATVAELRRRIQGSFSPGELRALGGALGVSPDDSWERGPDAAVRDLVRRALDGAGLHGLIEQLRRDKPLVEWGDLLPPARGGDTAIEAEGPDLETQATIVEAPALLDLTPPPMPPAEGVDEALAEPGEPRGAPPAGGAPEGGGAPPDALASEASEAATGPARAALEGEAPPASSGAAAPPSSAAWPMQNLATSGAPAPSSGLEPRLVAIAAACIALAIALAFVGGIVWSGRSARAAATPSGRAHGLAGDAASAMDAALVDVARGCGLEVPAAPGREVLRRAQASCGHPVAVAGRPPPGFDPHSIEPPKLDGGPSTQRRPVSPSGGADTPKAPTDPCRDACKAERNACKGRCGEEPRDASEFEAWQGCNAKCLSAESTCRQACR